MSAFAHVCIFGEREGRSPHPLIDLAWYRRHYGLATDHPLLHYLSEGWRQGLQTHPAFWARWFADRHRIASEPLLDYLTRRDGFRRDPNPVFDTALYRSEADVPDDVNPLVHYLRVGSARGDRFCHVFDADYFAEQCRRAGYRPDAADDLTRFLVAPVEVDPHPLFDRRFYRRQIGDGFAGNELGHFLDRKDPDLDPHCLFSTRFYYDARGDVVQAGYNALVHYLRFGWKEEVDTHPLFSARDYLSLNGDVAEAQANPLVHYVLYGAREGRPFRREGEILRFAKRARPVAIRSVPVAGPSAPRRALRKGVFVHAYYPDTFEEFIPFLNRIPQPCHVYISTDTAAKFYHIDKVCIDRLTCPYSIRICDNRGRDIAPMLVGYRDELEQVELALHIHTKRSVHYTGGFDQWRHYLVGSNLHPEKLDAILALFDDPSVGAVAPDDFPPVSALVQWGGNLSAVRGLVAMMTGFAQGVSSDTLLEMPTGSMFWFRTRALKPLLDLRLETLCFDPEAGQIDGTLAHAIERAFFYVIEVSGHRWLRFDTESSPGQLRVTEYPPLLPAESRTDPISRAMPEMLPFSVVPSRDPRPRLNLLIPTAERMFGYAGISEALRIFAGLRRVLGEGFDFRVIATDIAFSDQMVPEPGGTIADLHDESPAGLVYADGTNRRFQNLAVRASDVFVATAWWTAAHARELHRRQAALFDQPKTRFVYLIQDYECGFYAWSTRYALAESTYRDPDDFIAIFNTPILADYFRNAGYGIAGLVYEPPLNEEIARFIDRSAAKKKIALVYMRPSAQRNCLEFAHAVIALAKRSDPDFWRDWEFVAVGEALDKAGEMALHGLTSRGRLTLPEYGDLLSRASIGLSLMVSPHPSYPPLEMAAAGMLVLTNAYANKDLSALHGNIRSFASFDPRQVADRLRAMAADALADGPRWDASRIGWFFDGRTNLDAVVTRAGAEIAAQVPRAGT
ncbi:rhamnan synthesis F family protein [Methylobacterium oryzihabitans]|uniref:Rhamnan synthesis protein F n=1 Tax=Methylobacterium oryzihabitans TaxID=2499852 RepID=A0A3S2V7A5_9HYPH|nr:rhamnan synthesis F family protein [Methylobacterium oryzihabitans]RVU15597.1 hypothetical protein EOE48_18965 [Methylobacterium oryzihabitans]